MLSGAARCASAARRVADGIAREVLGLIAASTAVAALCVGCSPVASPPRFAPVNLPVLLSADGKTITGIGQVFCGRHPVLVAHLLPRKVTLTWLNPDIGCNGEPLTVAAAYTVLRVPFDGRPLVQAGTGKAIPYFRERDLAAVTVLPAGFRLTSDLPSVSFPQAVIAEPGDTRTYSAGSGQVSITQFVTLKGPFPLSQWPWPGRVTVNGQRAALLTVRSNGRIYERDIAWVDHGYRFVVSASAIGNHQPLSTAELTAIASGINLKPSQYRQNATRSCC